MAINANKSLVGESLRKVTTWEAVKEMRGTALR
jgi:hypothetical protein